MSLFSTAQHIDRRVKGILRGVDSEALSIEERKAMKQLKLICNEVKLDVRDYEYAETRAEQQKWAAISRRTISALEALLLELGGIFGPVDIAELDAQLETMKEAIS